MSRVKRFMGGISGSVYTCRLCGKKTREIANVKIARKIKDVFLFLTKIFFPQDFDDDMLLPRFNSNKFLIRNTLLEYHMELQAIA